MITKGTISPTSIGLLFGFNNLDAYVIQFSQMRVRPLPAKSNFLAVRMKRTLTLLFCGLIFSSFTGILPGQEDLGKIQKRSYSFKEAGKDIDYALYVPSGYKKAKPAPLLVLLHGLGSNPQQVIRYQGITAEAEKRGYIVVAPYGYNERGCMVAKVRAVEVFSGGVPAIQRTSAS